jgi:hypothetical protein
MTKRVILVLALGAVWAPVVAAETYSVTLASGATLKLLYPLQEAPWDKDTLVYLSEGGNWTGIHRSDVVAVQIETEFKGQGQLIDATTIFMGLAANDSPLPGDEREVNSTERLLQVLQELGKPQVINTDQFVEPGAAGGGGIPLNLTQPYSPQTGAPPLLPLGSGFNTGAAGGINLVPVTTDGGASQ